MRNWECGIGNAEWGKKMPFPIPHSAFRIPNCPLPVILSLGLLMKLVAEPFYPCLGAGPYCGALGH